jgi:uncharacterized protein with PIN domain
MLGHDVKYSTGSNDAELIVLAKKERRVLLTKDFELYQRSIAKGIEAFYVDGRSEAERLAGLAGRFGIALEIDLQESRCPNCNTKLRVALKEKIAGRVEDKTFEHYDYFWECPKCGKIYWQGAHWDRIRATLHEAKEKYEEKA